MSTNPQRYHAYSSLPICFSSLSFISLFSRGPCARPLSIVTAFTTLLLRVSTFYGWLRTTSSIFHSQDFT